MLFSQSFLCDFVNFASMADDVDENPVLFDGIDDAEISGTELP